MEELEQIMLDFIRDDAPRFGACFHEIKFEFAGNPHILEWRIRKKDNKPCCIVYTKHEYTIYGPGG